MPRLTGHASYSRILWALLALFCARVLGQLLVATLGVSFLPPMEEWFSGLIPYTRLLASQLVIIVLLGWVATQFSRGRGWVTRPNLGLGRGLAIVGTLYLGVMVIRYVIRMSLYPPERWTGGSIPIFFHWVLAGFVLTVALFHLRTAERSPLGRKGRALLASGGLAVVVTISAWVAYLLAPAYFAGQIGVGRPQHAVRIFRSQSFETSDGTRLVADLFRPRRADPAPTILVRIPYARTWTNRVFATMIGRMWAEHGYNVVLQGTRGRYESGGEHYPLVHERDDGVETLAWIDRQPWFDGRVGMWGSSYFGYTQWVLADDAEPAPLTFMIQLASTDHYGMFYHGGAFSLESALYWGIRSSHADDTPPDTLLMDRAFGTLPLVELDDRVEADVSYYNDWVSHTRRDEYWRAIDGEDRAARVTAPIHFMAGWFDPYLPTQLRDYTTILQSADPRVAESTHLTIGPWGHAFEPPLVDGSLPDNYRRSSIAPSVAWFDRYLKGDSAVPAPPPVRIFVLGANQWRDEEAWPLARAEPTAFYLNGDGGSLSVGSPPPGSGTLEYVFDPTDPVPTRGGAMLGARSGMRLQSNVERDDVLTFTTDPLSEPLEITGPVSAVLYVETSAPNTDFTAQLLYVEPDGRTFNITEGIVRREFRQDSGPERISIELWPTSIVLEAGRRLRLDIASSNYPRWDANPNTGRDPARETAPVSATQRIFWGGATPSHITLPLVPTSPLLTEETPR